MMRMQWSHPTPRILLLVAGIMWNAACGQAQQAATRPTASPFPVPSRPVADIVAPRWTAEPLRDAAGEAARVIRLAEITRGMHVADIGAGDGYYVSRLVPIVGAEGRVYGEDIMPQYLSLLERRVAREGWSNVSVVAGTEDNPNLPDRAVDVALMIHMYHEITQPFALLWHLAGAMKPNGRLVILDLERPTWGHGTPIALLRCELEAVGYREALVEWNGDEEYVAVYTTPTADTRPSPESIRRTLRERPCRAP
jgi:ubiquinone/menaquinone biosynthesis C-methylase UbiE